MQIRGPKRAGHRRGERASAWRSPTPSSPRARRVLVADRDRDGLEALAGRLRGSRPARDDRGRPRRSRRAGAARAATPRSAIGPARRARQQRRADGARRRCSRSRAVEWDRLFAVNLRAVFFLTQAVAARMADRGRGAVVSIASVNALRTEAPEAHYNATKAGIVAIMRSFANELGHRGVRFNCVAPGETVSADEAAAYTDDDLARTREYLQRVPMRRVGRPSEQAQVVLFLASDDGLLRQRRDDRRRRRRAGRRLVRHRAAARPCPSGSRASTDDADEPSRSTRSTAGSSTSSRRRAGARTPRSPARSSSRRRACASASPR